MKIAVIGTGNIGSRVGQLLRHAGHDVVWGARASDEGLEDVRSLEQAAAFGTVVIVAIPYGAWPEVAHTIGPLLDGKVVIDAGNPDRTRDGAFGAAALGDPDGSGAPVREILPKVRLVRSFSVIEAGALEREAHRDGDLLALPIAGDDPTALAVTSKLVADAGFDPVISGDLASAKHFDRGTTVFGGGLTAHETRQVFAAEAIA